MSVIATGIAVGGVVALATVALIRRPTMGVWRRAAIAGAVAFAMIVFIRGLVSFHAFELVSRRRALYIALEDIRNRYPACFTGPCDGAPLQRVWRRYPYATGGRLYDDPRYSADHPALLDALVRSTAEGGFVAATRSDDDELPDYWVATKQGVWRVILPQKVTTAEP